MIRFRGKAAETQWLSKRLDRRLRTITYAICGRMGDATDYTGLIVEKAYGDCLHISPPEAETKRMGWLMLAKNFIDASASGLITCVAGRKGEEVLQIKINDIIEIMLLPNSN